MFEFAYVLIVSILLNDEKVIEKRNKRKNKHLFIIENKKITYFLEFPQQKIKDKL